LDEHPFGCQNLGNLALRIEDVAELPGSRRAHFQARRISARPGALNTEMAFFRDPDLARTVAKICHIQVEAVLRHRRFGEVEMARSVWTRRHAIAASDAPVIVDHGDPIGLLPCRMHRAYLDAGRVLALLALHRHIEEPLLRDFFRIVVVIRLFDIERTVRHFQHPDVLDLRGARLVVLVDTGMHAFAAADTPREIQAIGIFHTVHRLEIADMGAHAVLLFDLVLDPRDDLFHVIRSHLLIVFLEELLHGSEFIEFEQRLETGGKRRRTGPEHGGST